VTTNVSPPKTDSEAENSPGLLGVVACCGQARPVVGWSREGKGGVDGEGRSGVPHPVWGTVIASVAVIVLCGGGT